MQKYENSCVLLVCIYNRTGLIFTHQYFYQLFIPYGQIIRILIFDKTKVWKTFIQYKNINQAKQAKNILNNKIILQDGSKLKIFPSKLKSIKFQNQNFGGVDYESLKQKLQKQENNQKPKRRNTYNENNYPLQTALLHHYSENQKQIKFTSFSNAQDISFKKTNSFQDSFINLYDVDQQLRQIALQSPQFRQWQSKEEGIRRKAKTVANPHSQQFLLQNRPSKVLFIRSIPENYDNQCLYNIFINFGQICRIINVKKKAYALLQFHNLDDSILAKDQLNYAKCQFRVFYSHYDNLSKNTNLEDQETLQCNWIKFEHQKKINNPPSNTLYMTIIKPFEQKQLRQKCEKLHCCPINIEWKENNNRKWMCLVQFANLSNSLYIMGCLQGCKFNSGRQLHISFTRSKISKIINN